MQFILRAFRLFGRERGLWRYAFRPLMWGVLAYAIVLFGSAGFGASLGKNLSDWLGGDTFLGGAIGAIAGIAVTIALGGAIYLALVGLIAGLGFDRLSSEVEEKLTGKVVGQPLGFAAGLGDGVARAVLAGILGLVGFCGAGTVVIPWLAAALLCLMDFTASPLLRRKISLGEQFGVARRLPGATGYALVAGVIVLIPVVNVLALPILVTAGTMLVIEGEKG